MTRFVMKLPDLGEGTVSAEVMAWKVSVGDLVAEDQPLAEMATDKAVVEVPSPVSGRVLSITGKPGDTIAVGAELVVFETEVAAAPARSPAVVAVGHPSGHPAGTGGRVRASPATRRRAREAGVDLASVAGSGPGGRILAADLASALAVVPAGDAVEELPVIGIRRLIAQRMTEAKRNAAHFAYVEEVDVTELEALRSHLNASAPEGGPPMSYLPFVVAALVRNSSL